MLSKPVEISRQRLLSAYPERPRDSHKGQFGRVAVIGGSEGMIGAALLAGRAALKLGSGLVHVGLLANNAPSHDVLHPELMLHSASALLRPSEHSKPLEFDVIAIGNGLGTSLAAQKILYDALRTNATLVLDADALNLLALRPDLRAQLLERNSPNLLTPHPGEAARLLNCSVRKIQATRIESAQKIAHRLNASVVLKGADSVIFTRDAQCYLNKTGNPGMSTAGMGDVLSAIIAALIAQGMSADAALLLGVHLHGAAGDALAEEGTLIGMSATEVTEWARRLLNQWLTERHN